MQTYKYANYRQHALIFPPA